MENGSRVNMLTALRITSILAIVTGAHADSATYTYDPLGRLSTATYSDGTVVSYTYDAAGNRTQHVVQLGVANQPPVAVDDSIVSQAAAVIFDPRTNDSDPNGDPITITAKTNGTHGSVAINSGASLTYTPTAGYAGSDSFTYTISDNQGGSDTGTVSVFVNQPPVAVADTISTPQDTAISFDPRTNDSDPNGDTLTITARTNGTHGAVVIVGGTSLTYTPAAGYSGGDSFTYTISDGRGKTATGTVSATVTQVNDPPTAVNDSIVTDQNTAITFDPRANDTDPEGGALTISSKTNGAHGTVAINSGTSLTYTPASNYTGSDSFTYTISDPGGATSTATVSATVRGPNHPPVATDDSFNGVINTYYNIDVLANDSDPDGDTLTIQSFSTISTKVTVSIYNNKLRVKGTSVGISSITYVVSDGRGGTDSGTLIVDME